MAVSPSIARGHKAKGILHPHPKYQKEKSLVGPDHTPDSSIDFAALRGSAMIPSVYIDTILRGYGQKVDLYSEVLNVSPDADARHLRIGYFRRGREVLTEEGVGGLEGLSCGTNLSDYAKTRFQAVSMAYEILSKPEWKEIYLRDGLVYPAGGGVLPQPSIRWNEQVEELLYEREPYEQMEMMEWKNDRERKKTKAKIMIGQDDEALHDHLARLDAEAEAHFSHDFLDTIEESLDGLLRFASNKSEQKTFQKTVAEMLPTADDDNSLTDETPVNTAFQRTNSTDEDSLVGLLASHIMRLGTGSLNDRISTRDTCLVPLSHDEATAPFRCVSPVAAPVDSLVAVAADIPECSETEKLANDDIFYGVDDENLQGPTSITLPDRRAASPSNLSNVSDLSESVATRLSKSNSPSALTLRASPHGARISTLTGSSYSVSSSVVRDVFQDGPDDEFVDDDSDWFQMSNIADAYSFGGRGDQDRDAALVVVTPEKVTGESSSQEEGFVAALAAFIDAIATECAAMGKHLSESEWPGAMVDACIIEHKDVDNLMCIVATELNQAPALDSSDAVQSPTLFAMEAATSFR